MAIDIHRNIWMVDTTLRDGEQAPGVVFNTSERLEIASLLSRIGIDEIEAGIPAMGDQACKDIIAISKLNLPSTLSCWCRANEKDLILAAGCDTPGVHISFPTSSLLLKTFDKNETWVLNNLKRMVNFAKNYFDRVSVGAQDATRTDFHFISEFSAQAFDAGAERLRIADTVGMINPSMVTRLIQDLTEAVPGLDFEFHGHNDLGMATANAVTAVDAGANALSVTVNGLGERAGNASLEEVVMALFEVGGYRKNIDTSMLNHLCRMVADASGQKISPSKPIIGKNIFRHESGIHCSGLIKNKSSYQLFDPEKVGENQCEYVLGYHSGSSTIEHILNQQGIQVDKDTAKKLLAVVRQIAFKHKEELSPKTLKQLFYALNRPTISSS